MNVLELDRYRKPAKPKKARNFEYFCQRCDYYAFKISENGEIRCAACEIPIKNLRAVPK
jgi:hypothetical protein